MRPYLPSRLLNACLLLIVLMLSGAGSAGAQKAARARLDSLITAARHAKPDTARVKLLCVIGLSLAPESPDSGTMFAQQAINLAQKTSWQPGIAAACNVLGTCELYRNNYARCIEYMNRALKIYQQENNKRGILMIVGNLGTVYLYQANYTQALENNFTALRYAEELGDTASIALNLNNIGSNYEYLKDYDKGLQYNFKALKLLQRMHDTVNIALTLGNIGNLYLDKNMLGEGLAYQQQALAYDERLGDNSSIARDLLNTVPFYTGMRNYGKALEGALRALDLSGGIQFEVYRAQAMRDIGSTFTAMAKDTAFVHHPTGLPPALTARYPIPSGKAALLAGAINYLKQSIALETEAANLDNEQLGYSLLAAAQKEAGLFKDALESKEHFITLKDSVFSISSKLKVANLETKRELDLKDKQIEIDQLEVAKKRNERLYFIAGILLLLAVIGIVIRNIRLKSAKELSENRLQAFQARMNPHFIFNSLNSIQSLVLAGETVPAITYLSRFSKLMRQILDSSAKSRVLLQTELDMLRGYIELEQLRFDRFTYELNVAPGISAEGTEVPAMIIQPFVENAIIHGILPKKGEGRLTVTFERKEGCIICTIDDNGIGRLASAALNAERRKDHESHGISIASNRLALLSKKRKGETAGVMYIDKEEAGMATGTTVILQIPVL